MKNIIKTVSLLSIIAVIPGAFAATSRVSVANKASPRLPSIAGRLISGTTTGTTTTTTSSTAAYYSNSECIEKYTDCLKEDDVCGSDFQECTTNVLFHGQMSKCLSVLYQCSSNGVNALFGTTAINALSNVATTATVDGVTEVTKYTYPTDGSVLGQLIIGAGITNKLTTEQCVRRYTNCLQRDDICGADFELCTTPKTFKKQALLCDSTLQRCQNDGKQQLFGSVANATSLHPSNDSRLGQLIDEGSALAALNAVKTCQRVADNCLVSACAKNPLSCVEGTSLASIDAADIIAEGTGVLQTSTVTRDDGTETATATSVRKLLKTACLETIGSNRYCHMTYREKVPSDRELGDPDLQEEVFSLAYSARKDYAKTKIQEAMKKFDTRAKDNCLDTIKSCAMRSCGGGLGSVCYKQSRIGSATSSSTTKDVSIHVNGKNTYNDIFAGCSAIVNADANCIYAATSTEDTGYMYTYYDEDNSTFNKLFPEYSDSVSDPIGAVGTLNSILATSYNDAAIENMKKQCQTIALSCVKSMCGKDYTNCYRNRTDIVSGTYDTDQGRLDRSMNKMGGILDYNIVIGLCMNTVKSSPVCEEHLKVATATWRNSEYRNDNKETWQSYDGKTTVRDNWLNANTTKAEIQIDESVIVGCRVPTGIQVIANNAPDTFIDDKPDCSGIVEPINGSCDGVIDGLCIYNEPVYMGEDEYVLTNGAKTLFQTLLVDVEKEAQAIYNAKLTREQNVCLANNAGGIMGSKDNGSTFMWVKLRSSKVPNTYQSKGLTTKQFVASNDLYGSFCRAKITVQSDDKDIQDLLKDSSAAYFAVGDSFTCGSWISNSTLQRISEKVGEREVCKQGYGKWEKGECNIKGLSTKEKLAYAWGTVAPALAGTGIGIGLTESGLLGGWSNSANSKLDGSSTQKKNKENCESYASLANSANDLTLCQSYLNSAKSLCSSIGGTADICNQSISGNNEDEKLSDCRAKAQVIGKECDMAYNTDMKTKMGARVAIPIVTGVAAGGLGAGITASVLKANKENIKNEAAQQWMEEIGEHIQCYIGTEELGTYGDVVSIELD